MKTSTIAYSLIIAVVIFTVLVVVNATAAVPVTTCVWPNTCGA